MQVPESEVADGARKVGYQWLSDVLVEKKQKARAIPVATIDLPYFARTEILDIGLGSG